jgi:hypothetical protein
MVTASPPAISDMLVSTGASPRSSSIASRPTAETPRASSAFRSSGRAAGRCQNANTTWPGCSSA